MTFNEYPKELQALIIAGRDFAFGAELYGVRLKELSKHELRSLLAITLAGQKARAEEGNGR